MDENMIWKVVDYQDMGLVATKQILEGTVQRTRYYGGRCSLERN